MDNIIKINYLVDIDDVKGEILWLLTFANIAQKYEPVYKSDGLPQLRVFVEIPKELYTVIKLRHPDAQII